MRNYIAAVMMLLPVGYSAYAQSDDMIEYEPVHSTFLPGDGHLKIDEKYDKKASVYFSGDELVLKSKGFKPALAQFVLPVNPVQDYVVEFSLRNYRPKTDMVTVAAGSVAVGFCGKLIFAMNGNDDIYKNTKWKLPVSSAGEITIKIERRKKNVMIYIGGQYICETQVQALPGVMPCALTLHSTSGEIVLHSIRVDQGEGTPLD